MKRAGEERTPWAVPAFPWHRRCPSRHSRLPRACWVPGHSGAQRGTGCARWNASLGHRRTSTNSPHFQTPRWPRESLAAEGRGRFSYSLPCTRHQKPPAGWHREEAGTASLRAQSCWESPEATGETPALPWGSSRLRCRRKQQLNAAEGVGGFPHPHPPGTAGAGAAGRPELPNLAKSNVSSVCLRNAGSRFTCLLQKGSFSSPAAKSC